MCLCLKIYGWMPASGSVSSSIMNATGQPLNPIDEREENIYVTCDAKNSGDKAAMGPMMYYSLLNTTGHPSYGGIPYYFFPYM